MSATTILWTEVDEAPALATYSLLPIVQAFLAPEIKVETRDISLAGRILSQFPDSLSAEQRSNDDLSELGTIAKTPAANIIKLPNISASVPQLKACVAELQAKGYPIPDFTTDASTAESKAVSSKFKKVMGSAVNPVLREGNSDRRGPPAVKAYARANPHKLGHWAADSKTRIAHMSGNDFFGNEKSISAASATSVRFEHEAKDGKTTVLKASVPLLEGEILDTTFMSKNALVAFFEEQCAAAKAEGLLLSVHLKATMMKISDPIIFGYAVKAFFKPLFEAHGDVLAAAGANVRNGFGDVLGKIATLPEAQRTAVEATLKACYDNGPALAMVDSSKGITNLHVPSDVIIDASVPAMVRDSGKMWNADNKLQDTIACIPDRSYATMYQACVADCQKNGRFDVTTMGTSPNVGLMAQKAEEYGSHDKTFEMAAAGTMRVIDNTTNAVLMEHVVEQDDIWRGCAVKPAPVTNWIELAVRRCRLSNTPVVFWLDAKRAHDALLISRVQAHLATMDTQGLSIQIMAPVEAINFTMERIRRGEDTISATGNVLRDYLTDLFPILEVGTSAKMLSIVPLMAGGGLFETGAGGSAPKHVQQFQKESYLRWDSLGEFLALAVSLDHMGETTSNPRAKILGATLNAATEKFLITNKSPARKLGGIDNRGSHYYLATYWAEALAASEDAQLAARFAPVSAALAAAEAKINAELIAGHGTPTNTGGYYKPDKALVAAAMRPSPTFNAIIDGLAAAPVSNL